MKIETEPNPSRYKMPKPTRLLILDNLSDSSEMKRGLLQDLTCLVNTDRRAMLVDVSTLAKRLQKKIENRFLKEKFDLLVYIGSSGEEVARLLDLKAPSIRLNPTRIVNNQGMSTIVSKSGTPLSLELEYGIETTISNRQDEEKTIGIVDDVIFFGETIYAVSTLLTRRFPNATLSAFVLAQAKPLTNPKFIENVDVLSGITLNSDEPFQQGINIINAIDLISPDALPLSNGKSLSFSQEPNWMRSWFGSNVDKANGICVKLLEFEEKGEI